MFDEMDPQSRTRGDLMFLWVKSAPKQEVRHRSFAMAASVAWVVRWTQFVLFLSLSGVLLMPPPGVNGQFMFCPALCACLEQFVDCTRKGLTTVPQDLPTWTQRLWVPLILLPLRRFCSWFAMNLLSTFAELFDRSPNYSVYGSVQWMYADEWTQPHDCAINRE